MTEPDKHNDDNLQDPPLQAGVDDRLDPALKYLSGALKSAFIVLKVIMVFLVVVFLASGIRIVGSDEQALVLSFGKIRGAGEKRILGPGLKLLLPYPIHEIVKIPVEKKINLRIDSFWYQRYLDDTLPEGPKGTTRVSATLNPVRDGYCIVRNEEQGKIVSGYIGGDYNVVHSRWQLTYRIDEPELFFRNVYVEDIKPGQTYFEVITRSITPLLKNLLEDAVVTAMVNYTIDEALRSQDRIPNHVEKLLQSKLNTIESGIKVVSVQLDDVTWPRQVEQAFLASHRASQESQRLIKQAQADAGKILNEAAGPVAAELIDALENENIGDGQRQFLWTQLAGAAQVKIAQARAYRIKVVESAKASANYLKELLPEYRKRPQLVVQKIYQDAIEHVLNNADEKIIIQPAENVRGRELRILINRDPRIKPKSDRQSELE